MEVWFVPFSLAKAMTAIKTAQIDMEQAHYNKIKNFIMEGKIY